MKARRLIDGASYGPDALRAIGQAFDETCASIAGNFRDTARSPQWILPLILARAASARSVRLG
jgi:hypothetical protein